MEIAVLAYLGVVIGLSLVTFAVYGVDKRRAGTTARRIPEQTLHLLSLAGGWPGALLGQRQFRHKTRKVSFQVVFWIIVVMHLAAVGVVGWVMTRSVSN